MSERDTQFLWSGIVGGRDEFHRADLKIFLSEDECQTWPVSILLYSGAASYSELVILPNGTVLCFFEGGEKHSNESIRIATFDVDWLSSDQKRQAAANPKNGMASQDVHLLEFP